MPSGEPSRPVVHEHSSPRLCLCCTKRRISWLARRERSSKKLHSLFHRRPLSSNLPQYKYPPTASRQQRRAVTVVVWCFVHSLFLSPFHENTVGHELRRSRLDRLDVRGPHDRGLFLREYSPNKAIYLSRTPHDSRRRCVQCDRVAIPPLQACQPRIGCVSRLYQHSCTSITTTR